MSMTLVDLRHRMRLAGRNVSSYTAAQIDEAIDRLCARFLRVTRCVKLSFTVNFTASGNTVDFSGLAGFLPDRIERARINVDSHYTAVHTDLDQAPAEEVLDALACRSATTSSYCGDTLIGFTGTVTAKLFPAPGFNGTISGTYSPLQTPWAVGTMGVYSTANTYSADDLVSNSGSLYRSLIPENANQSLADATKWQSLGTGSIDAPADVISVIPDGLMSELIGAGGPPILQAVDKAQVSFTGPAWASYLAFEQSCMGVGSISGKSSTRQSLRR